MKEIKILQGAVGLCPKDSSYTERMSENPIIILIVSRARARSRYLPKSLRDIQ